MQPLCAPRSIFRRASRAICIANDWVRNFDEFVARPFRLAGANARAWETDGEFHRIINRTGFCRPRDVWSLYVENSIWKQIYIYKYTLDREGWKFTRRKLQWGKLWTADVGRNRIRRNFYENLTERSTTPRIAEMTFSKRSICPVSSDNAVYFYPALLQSPQTHSSERTVTSIYQYLDDTNRNERYSHLRAMRTDSKLAGEWVSKLHRSPEIDTSMPWGCP